MNINKFKMSEGDYDYSTLERKISGRITKERRKTIEHVVRDFNRRWSAPYGISPNGYAYSCGCEHDCCGCLVGKSASLVFEKLGRNNIAIVRIHESFNY